MNIDRFDISSGNITFSIPTEIEIEGETIYLDHSMVQDQREDYEGNLCAVQLQFETELVGRVALFIKVFEGELLAAFGTLSEDESLDGIDYEHPEDRPYDLLPEEELSEAFIDNILILVNDY